ncbi:hypothetical protein ACS0TY_013568 [Phlomoides rotata]
MAIPNDESSLLALKSPISDDPDKIIATNWSTSNPFCSWIGVICSKRHHRITNLGNNNFTGSISSFLTSLLNLQTLDLSNNEFSGAIPASVARISDLQYLSFTWNLLEGIFRKKPAISAVFRF